MAKRRRGRRKGLGSVITIRRLGMGSLDKPDSMTGALLPVLIGGAITTFVTLGLQNMAPTPDNEAVRNNAGWIGFGAGGLASLALWNLARPASGIMALSAAAVALLATKLPGWLADARASAATQPGTAGLRAVVPEYSSMRGVGGGRGMGAIVMQPQATRGLGKPGEVINLSGINTSVFGTPAFKR